MKKIALMFLCTIMLFAEGWDFAKVNDLMTDRPVVLASKNAIFSYGTIYPAKFVARCKDGQIDIWVDFGLAFGSMEEVQYRIGKEKPVHEYWAAMNTSSLYYPHEDYVDFLKKLIKGDQFVIYVDHDGVTRKAVFYIQDGKKYLSQVVEFCGKQLYVDKKKILEKKRKEKEEKERAERQKQIFLKHKKSCERVGRKWLFSKKYRKWICEK